MTAAFCGFVEIINFLLNPGPGLTGAKIDMQDCEKCTALINAILKNQPDCVEALLKHGANPNLPSGNGWSPLNLACKRKNKKVITLLVEYGANALVIDHVSLLVCHAVQVRACTYSYSILLVLRRKAWCRSHRTSRSFSSASSQRASTKPWPWSGASARRPRTWKLCV